jgi:hypothetical protein
MKKKKRKGKERQERKSGGLEAKAALQQRQSETKEATSSRPDIERFQRSNKEGIRDDDQMGKLGGVIASGGVAEGNIGEDTEQDNTDGYSGDMAEGVEWQQHQQGNIR